MQSGGGHVAKHQFLQCFWPVRLRGRSLELCRGDLWVYPVSWTHGQDDPSSISTTCKNWCSMNGTFKNTCFSMILDKKTDSAAEWWCPHASTISFYKDIYDFQGRRIKPISFYGELCMSKDPCFIVVCWRAQTLVFIKDFIEYWSCRRSNHQ